ncbi:MAG TPA: ubiquinol-cytochrome c reductase iron-sulfur subunit [Gallionella sp.]|nr:ubiquinol-cytochrome c reductase iron-sulfur subunit [Gallionella sp.]
MSDVDVPNNHARREFLSRATIGVGAAGAVAVCWPFISSMNPSSDVLGKATTEVDLAAIRQGEMRTVSWQGKPVFVLHRTADQIKAMEASQGGLDPELDHRRVKQAEWLVVVGVCTHLGCVPNRNENGWLCPCHGSVYDNSGRVVKGPAPRNLDVPPYRFLSADRIVIGAA